MDDEYDRPRRERNGADERDHGTDHPPRRGSSGRSTWLVLGAAGCVLVLVCSGALAALVYWGFRSFTTDIPAAQEVADRFLDHVRAGKLDDAYALTSSDFRAEYDRERFAEFIKKFDTFGRHTSRTQQGFRLFHDGNGKHVFIQTTLNAPNNAMTCTLVLIEKEGVWKVDKITVP
jgi:hypothetical protein